MKIILEERGLWPVDQDLKAQCPNFQCPQGLSNCCASQLLFSQPDFANQKSELEEIAESHGHSVIYYPKFHCELNFNGLGKSQIQLSDV